MGTETFDIAKLSAAIKGNFKCNHADLRTTLVSETVSSEAIKGNGVFVEIWSKCYENHNYLKTSC